MGQLVVGSDDGTMTILVKLRTTSATKYLHYIQDTQIHKRTLLGIINIGALQVEQLAIDQ